MSIGRQLLDELRRDEELRRALVAIVVTLASTILVPLMLKIFF
jgi:hypothetical protein